MNNNDVTYACSRCGASKPSNAFYILRRRGKVTHQPWCKLCHAEYYKQKARDNPRYFLDFQLRARRSKGDRVLALRVERGCADCGENHPACLEFHHLDPADKSTEVRKLVERNTSWDIIEKEIAKCIVLCSNCHRKRHWPDRARKRAEADIRVQHGKAYVRRLRVGSLK